MECYLTLFCLNISQEKGEIIFGSLFVLLEVFVGLVVVVVFLGGRGGIL